MNNETIGQASKLVTMVFSPDWVKAALMLALIAVGMVIAMCLYLNRWTNKRHYGLWMVGWMFYAAYLVMTFILEEITHMPQLVMAQMMFMGMSALFMLWGVWDMTNPRPRLQLITAAVVTLLVWSYLAAYVLPASVWNSAPVFALLAGASAWAGLHYGRERSQSRSANILTMAFMLWAAQLAVFSVVGIWPVANAIGHATSAVLTLTVAMALIAKEESALSEQKYRGVLDNAEHGIVMVDLWSLKMVDANPRAYRLTKRTPEKLLGCPITDLCPDLRKRGDNILDIRNMFNAVFRENTEFHILCGDNTHVLCEGSTTLCQWNKRPVFQINLREANTTGKTGQIIRRAEKLSSLGRLIAGVAHELNNPLAVVVGYSQLMVKQPIVDGKLKDTLVKVLHESERAAKIVRDLLSFARPCEPQLAPVSVGHLVCNVLDVREADLQGHAVELESSIPPNLPMTMADAIQVEQVLNNLITNAIHALASQPSETRKLTVSVEESSIFLRVVVADSGPGIPAANIEKIFEPFFTTKDPGKGTGLGLSISNTIIQEHHGRIWVESEVGQGARFFIELPIVACPLADEPAAAPVVVTPVATSDDVGRLLVVDDEPGIREVLKEILTCNGYHVDTACDGAEALRRIGSVDYDLIISDLCMPGMDGEKLYQAIREKDEDLADRIIFVTGDTVSPKSRDFLESIGNRWLSKPFNIRDVEEAVRSLLAREVASLY